MTNSINGISTLDRLTQNKGISPKSTTTADFGKILGETIANVNEFQVQGDKALADMATGEVKDLHQAALAIGKAETSMRLMLEIRNKALNVYKEISQTQI